MAELADALEPLAPKAVIADDGDEVLTLAMPPDKDTGAPKFELSIVNCTEPVGTGEVWIFETTALKVID